MQFYSTNNKELKADLKTAVMKSLAQDKGLFMPEVIPQLRSEFLENIENYSFTEIAFEIASTLFTGYIPEQDLKQIIKKAIDFDAPVKMLDDRLGVLELWHGPSLAFKDFGARFMAGLMSYFIAGDDKPLTILVATSGDTGGAVAFGFLGVPNIEVIILYPKGKVSLLQEKQLTTLGQNIKAIEVDGTFDDCQAMVKEAFLDQDLNKVYELSSANSINIARLIPQSFYYAEAYKVLKKNHKKVVFSVPSGNFGNLTAGLLIKRMGLPIDKFIAATNINDVVPQYLKSGEYNPRPSLATISNAMDVGNPSNFTRMLDLYGGNLEAIQADVEGFFATDEETKLALKEIYDQYQYVADPHGAIGYMALKEYLAMNSDAVGVFLETAHPAKFEDTVESAIGTQVEIPERLAVLVSREKKAAFLNKDFAGFKAYLLKAKI